MKKIYILKSEDERELIRDALFSRKIAELHREEVIDVVFIYQSKNHPSTYPLLRNYCQENQSSGIEIIDLTDKTDIISNHFFKIYRCFKKNKQKDIFVYISEQECKYSLERLVGLLSQEFQVDEINLLSDQETANK